MTNTISHKTCKQCKRSKRIKYFKPGKSYKGGYAHICSKCNIANNEPWKNYRQRATNKIICPCKWALCSVDIQEGQVYRHMRLYSNLGLYSAKDLQKKKDIRNAEIANMQAQFNNSIIYH